MVEEIETAFPRLRGTAYRVTSPPDPDYNCIAWAAGVTTNWWWPLDDHPKGYWPPGAPLLETLEAFAAVFAALGYVASDHAAVEPGVEKVALFTDAEGGPTHAARQLPNGRWTSKLGRRQDIEHALRDLEGDAYGAVALIMKRPLTTPKEAKAE
jgi:hypothetical protein